MLNDLAISPTWERLWRICLSASRCACSPASFSRSSCSTTSLASISFLCWAACSASAFSFAIRASSLRRSSSWRCNSAACFSFANRSASNSFCRASFFSAFNVFFDLMPPNCSMVLSSQPMSSICFKTSVISIASSKSRVPPATSVFILAFIAAILGTLPVSLSMPLANTLNLGGIRSSRPCNLSLFN